MSSEELFQINGGISKGVILGGLAIAISFIVGVIDGYLRPLSCNK